MAVDVVVVGGGPIGLATALMAARTGLVPVVVEPRLPPIDKACGEGLMPGAVAALSGLGVELRGHPFRGIRYVDGSRSVEALFRGGSGRGVRRTELHAALVTAVDRAGVEMVRAAMTDLIQDADGVRVELNAPAGGVVRGRYAVAADGLHSPTRRLLGLEMSRREVRRYGLRRHFGVAPWSDLVEVHWSKGGEAYVTPVGEEEVGVALLGSGRGSWEDRLAEFPVLRGRLTGDVASEVMGAGPLRQRCRSRRSGRVLLVGDAGGYVDALTGEGIAVGLAQAREAVRAIAIDSPQTYPRAAARVSRRTGLITAGLLAVTRRPRGRPALLGAAHGVPRAFDAAVNLMVRD